ncbi:unnamed protein product [Owenia fusiformis]|uniref:Temptin n=1 Tax=Owenia fusiformis TaxID=6347 RepID=A0A8S4PHA4_OWEFU|nr:unnamed protein product [Owenia fusiformis]
MIKMNFEKFVLFFTISTLNAVVGYKYFQDKVPNGDNIPHPCKPNYIWQGLGHKNAMGGGDRNPFGLAFEANGKVWNAALCNADSDNDGKTNGAELGDPDCTWTEGSIPKITTGLSHPGVCEPWDSAECLNQNQWEFCDSDVFSCPAMDATDDVRNVSVRFPSTQVPATETNYYCMTVELPVDGDYHLIATTPTIDNAYVMHHMLLFGCKEDDLTGDDSDVRTKFATPRLCGMDTGCKNIITTWTLGSAGECYSDLAAFRIGKHGYKYAVLQMHWNNPELRSDYTDSSGLTLFYTPNLRPNDAGYFIVGQRHLEIEGGQESHMETALISPSCTRQNLPYSINILTTALHMHYLGKSGLSEHRRDGNKILTFGRDDVYSYDSPVTHVHDPPREFLPGDEVYVSCTFDSQSRTETTYYGDDTKAEMCYAFFQYYPVIKNLTAMLRFKDIEICSPRSGTLMVQGCDVRSVMSQTALAEFSEKVLDKCSATGDVCKPECKDMVKETRLNDNCMGNEEVYELVKALTEKESQLLNIWRAFESCDSEIKKDEMAGSASILCASITQLIVVLLTSII